MFSQQSVVSKKIPKSQKCSEAEPSKRFIQNVPNRKIAKSQNGRIAGYRGRIIYDVSLGKRKQWKQIYPQKIPGQFIRANLAAIIL